MSCSPTASPPLNNTVTSTATFILVANLGGRFRLVSGPR